MDFTQLAILAIVQGVTEFLPISSSGHLILAAKLFGMERSVAEGTIVDVALHLGSLFAVFVYFWRDLRDAMIGPFTLVGDIAAGRPLRWPSKLALLLVVSTIPLVLAGLALIAFDLLDQLRDESGLQLVRIIGWTTLIYGLLLYVADRFSSFEREIKDWTWGSAVLMGCAQALALVPGTSRSGICMTAGRFLGFDRREAARIALLMAIPAIMAPSALSAFQLYNAGDLTLTTDAGIGAGLSFVSAYIALVLMMRWLRTATFTPFVVYRIVLGGVLLSIGYGVI